MNQHGSGPDATSGRPYVLQETTLGQSRGGGVEVAVLPWGATEPHNLHLPFGTDTIQVQHIAAESCRLAYARGASVTVLPAISIGANAQQLSTPLTLNLNPSTQAQILSDLVESLAHHGVGKLLVLNGHGGNDFRQMIRELQPRTSVFLCTANWYTARDPAAYFEEPGDHAGELETSVMMYLRPDLMRPLHESGPGAARSFRIEGLREGLAWAPRDWKQVSEDTGVGNPRAATPEKGRHFFKDVTEALADFLVELAAADVEDMYAPLPNRKSLRGQPDGGQAS